MSEESTMGLLTQARQKIERLEEGREDVMIELETLRQESAAMKDRIGALDRRQALAGKFDIKQILTMLGGSGGVAALVSGPLMYIITAEVAKTDRKVEAIAPRIEEVKAEASLFEKAVEARLQSGSDWMRSRERVEGDLQAKVGSLELQVKNARDDAAAAGLLRWTSKDHERYAAGLQLDREQDERDSRMRWEMLIKHAERISRLEGGAER